MMWAAGAVAAMSSITFPAVSALVSQSADPDKQGDKEKSPPCLSPRLSSSLLFSPLVSSPLVLSSVLYSSFQSSSLPFSPLSLFSPLFLLRSIGQSVIMDFLGGGFKPWSAEYQ